MKQKRHAAGRTVAAPASPALPHTAPDQPDDRRPNLDEARLRTIRTPHPDMKTRQTHRLMLSELCPASRNPLPGATLLVFYKTRKRFLDVFSLSAYIRAAVEQPAAENVETFTQAVALDCAAALGQKVYVEGRYPLRELGQEVVCIVKAYPPKSKDKTRDRNAKAGKARKTADEPAPAKAGKLKNKDATAGKKPRQSAPEALSDKADKPIKDEKAAAGQQALPSRVKDAPSPRETASSGKPSTVAASTASASSRTTAPAPRSRSAKAAPQATPRSPAGASGRTTAARSRRTTSSSATPAGTTGRPASASTGKPAAASSATPRPGVSSSSPAATDDSAAPPTTATRTTAAPAGSPSADGTGSASSKPTARD